MKATRVLRKAEAPGGRIKFIAQLYISEATFDEIGEHIHQSMRDSYIIAIQQIAVAMDTRKGYRKMNHLKPILSFSFILLLVLLASSCSQSPTNAKVEVNKSPNDDREYQYLLLDNKLKMLPDLRPGSRKIRHIFCCL